MPPNGQAPAGAHIPNKMNLVRGLRQATPQSATGEWTTGSEDNANLVRRGYAAFRTGDMGTLSELFANDAVWHVPGSTRWGLVHEFAESGSNRVDQNAVNIFHIRDGRVSEVWELHDDRASNAWLWA